MEQRAVETNNPLGYKPIPSLLFSMALPAVIANLFNAIYNIVDQVFIGHTIGYLGNAATNIAYPLTTLSTAIGFMLGVGAAAGYNLNLGNRKQDQAKKIVGTAVSSMIICGVVLCILVAIFLKPLMIAFGATEEILPYVMTYAGITLIGFPFLLISTGGSPLIRGDGNAKYAMACVLTGTVINIVLDYTFIYICGWGIAGAAWATVIGQVISAVMMLVYFPRFKHVHFEAHDFIPRWDLFILVCKLGFASFAYLMSMLITQIVLNNLLKKYGDLSAYGSAVAIAIAGIMTKINMIFTAVVTGIVQGSQPIISFNYGAKKYRRVRDTTRLLLISTTAVSVIVFALMELFPTQIIGFFGEGSPEYFAFGTIYVRAFCAVLFLNGIQVSCATFFPSIGKAWKGSVISLSKQLGLLVPLLLILSFAFGINGIVAAAPIADLLAFLIAFGFLLFEMRQMPKEDMTV